MFFIILKTHLKLNFSTISKANESVTSSCTNNEGASRVELRVKSTVPKLSDDEVIETAVVMAL